MKCCRTASSTAVFPSAKLRSASGFTAAATFTVAAAGARTFTSTAISRRSARSASTSVSSAWEGIPAGDVR